MGAYHNTTATTGPTLDRYESTAAAQEREIAALFRRLSRCNPGRLLTPSYVHELLHTTAPLTSTRRAITNLTNRGVLEKTAHQRPGPYGRPEHCWRLRLPERNKPMSLPFEAA